MIKNALEKIAEVLNRKLTPTIKPIFPSNTTRTSQRLLIKPVPKKVSRETRVPKNTPPRFDKIDNDWKSIETRIQTIKSKLKKLPVKMPLGKPTDIHFFNVPTPKCQQHNPEETLYNQLFPT